MTKTTPHTSSTASSSSSSTLHTQYPHQDPTTTNTTLTSQLTTPSTLLSTLILTSALLFTRALYKRYLRRLPNISHIPPTHYRHRSLFGTVTSVGDGDNFRLYHTPGGRLAGWGILPLASRRVPSNSDTLIKDKRTGKMARALTDKTVHVRIAGIDAPELAHFGRPAQPFGEEALTWLKGYVLGERVRVVLYRRDQYDRVVASVKVRKGWGWGRWLGPLVTRDVGLEMIKAGYATVYEAKTGSEFGDLEASYRAAERLAQDRGRGMWVKPGLLASALGKERVFESPREYKTRVAAEEAAQKDQQHK